ncbi:MAG: Ig-like domain-containing protein [Planctomycetaceae bacterium]|nr:Ig-like domain-containing protein [Planctomycetaceae bacterium]
MKHTYLLFIVIFLFAGCAQRGPVVQFVEGTVTFDGAAVAEAEVCFTPKGAEGIPAVGKTDANGLYRLTSAKAGCFRTTAGRKDYERFDELPLLIGQVGRIIFFGRY